MSLELQAGRLTARMAGGNYSQEEKDEMKAQLAALQVQLQQAKRARDEQDEAISTRINVANPFLAPSQRQLLGPKENETALRHRIGSGRYGSDEVFRMRAELSENDLAQDGAQRVELNRSDKMYLDRRSAGYARGYGGRAQAITDQQSVLGREMDANTLKDYQGNPIKGAFADQSLGAQQIAQQAQLKRAAEDLAHTKARELSDAQQSVKVADLQAHGFDLSAQKANETYNWQTKITEALRDNNKELAAYYQQQEGIAEGSRRLHAFLHPEEATAERANARQNARDTDRMEASGGLTNLVRGADGSVIGGYDAQIGQNRMLTPAERAKAAAAKRSTLYDGSTKAKDALGGSASGSFDKFFDKPEAFEPVSAAEQNRPTVPTDPMAGMTDSISTMNDNITKMAQAFTTLQQKLGVA